MIYTSDLDNIDLEAGIQECTVEPGMEAALKNVQEMEENWTLFKEAVGISELSYFEENGKDKVYLEADMGSFIEAVKRFFRAVIEKIKGLFTKFKAMIMKLVLSDKDFVKKYKGSIIGKSLENYKGYKFSPDAIDPAGGLSKCKTFIQGADLKDSESTSEELRGKIIGDGKKYSASEFTSELFSKLRNGESSKEALTFAGSDQVSIISDSKTEISKASKSMTGIEKEITALVKSLENDASTELKNKDSSSDHISSINAKLTAYKEATKFAEIANGALLTALKHRRGQAKSICVKLVSQKKEKNSTNESAGFGGEGINPSLSNLMFK